MTEKRTKIVCTIGPASEDKTTLVKMIKAGMNVARLNFSHGTYPNHKKLIQNIRKASKETGQVISILQDLQGPRIRLGDLPEEGVTIKKGDTVTFTTEKKSKNKIPVTYNKLHQEIKKGERILVADGIYEFEVQKVSKKDIVTKAKTSANLSSHKGMNFPDSNLKISSLSEKDISDLEFGIQNNVDFVALSFVRSAQDVKKLISLIEQFEKKHNKTKDVRPQVIVKIEKPEAIENFDEILEITDGVMVARGDLGIELPAQDVPLLQKEMIARCNAVAKPVIVATQMLESMTEKPRPTRAEVSDVANAVIDHTDAVMLSGESAMGKYPVQAVQIMSETVKEVEESVYDDLDYSNAIWKKLEGDEALAASAAILSTNVQVDAMLITSLTGYTARLISKYRPELPIYVTTNSDRVMRQLNLSWGLIPMKLTAKSITSLTNSMKKKLIKEKRLKKNSQVIIVEGKPKEDKGRHLRSIELTTI